MDAFAGSEPLVGEVVGLRTFRVDESGFLLPLFSTLSWYDGANAATCAPPTGESGYVHHVAPDPACECGFYAYGTEAAARQNRQMRYVQAVVSCWGSVIAGTQGIRAQYARIDAIWLHPNVPVWVRHRVAQRYPSARIYQHREAMLAEHPLTQLDCYLADPPRRRRQLGAMVAVGAVLAVGALPGALLHSSAALWWGWLMLAGVVAALAGWLLVAAHTPGHRTAALLTLGVLAWLLAPLLGWPGWLLRLPVLRGVLVVTGGYLLSLRPGYFPIDRAPRERAFCGVRA